ncbi:MAG: glycosyltransferase [Phycisphaerales bacterium]|nr:glycosyltransferase [Phycisphaerales bacterium]
MQETSSSDRDGRRLRVLFAAGSGDVAGTLRKWNNAHHDERIFARAYSSEIYSLAHERSWRLFCFPNNSVTKARAGQIAVFPFPKPKGQGILFFLNEYRYGRAIARLAKRLRVDVMIIATGMHPVGLLGASLANVPMIVSLHNTYWIRSGSPPKGAKGILLRLSARSLKRRIHKVVAVSEEIRQQVLILWGIDPSRVRVHIPQYDLQTIPVIDPPVVKPYRILFAGRAEQYKGIGDIIEAAKIIETTSPGLCTWVIAGDGSSLSIHRAHAKALGIERQVEFLGQIDRTKLVNELALSRITITPTRKGFNEGLAKLPLEGAIMGRPAIVSSVVPALDLLGEAAEEVRPESPHEIAEAVKRLCSDDELYMKRRNACGQVRELTSDPSQSFRHHISESVNSAIPELH